MGAGQFSLLLLLGLYEKIHAGLLSPQGWVAPFGAAALFVLFFLAYKKQTGYIVQRVERTKANK